MSSKKDIDTLAVATLQKEQDDRNAQNFLMAQNMEGNMGKGVIALLVMFFSFKRDPSGQSFTDNPAIKDLFSAIGFSQEDMDFAKITGNHLRNGDISAIEATKSVFERIKTPQKTLASPEAKKAVENIVTKIPKLDSTKLDNKDIPEHNKITANQQQVMTIETIPLAAKATGVSPDLMKAMWGVESRFGKDSISPTGCEGPWQFSQATWDSIMKKHGDEIVALIKEQRPDYKDITDDIASNHTKAGSLNEYQYDPVVSTYAAAFLMKDDAKTMGIDPMKRENWGMTYAAYNIGAGNAKKLVHMEANGDQRNAMSVIGSAARNNPLFFKGGATANLALNRYDSALERRFVQYQQKLSHIEQTLTTQAIAKNNTTEETNDPEQSTLALAFAKGGVEENDPAQPIVLTAEHTKTMAKGGVDQVALADDKEQKPAPEQDPSAKIYVVSDTPDMSAGISV